MVRAVFLLGRVCFLVPPPMESTSHGTTVSSTKPKTFSSFPPTKAHPLKWVEKQPSWDWQYEQLHPAFTRRRHSWMKGTSIWLWTGSCLATVLLVLMSISVSSMVSARAPSLSRAAEARTDDVRFDNYSLILKGQRVFL